MDGLRGNGRKREGGERGGPVSGRGREKKGGHDVAVCPAAWCAALLGTWSEQGARGRQRSGQGCTRRGRGMCLDLSLEIPRSSLHVRHLSTCDASELERGGESHAWTGMEGRAARVERGALEYVGLSRSLSCSVSHFFFHFILDLSHVTCVSTQRKASDAREKEASKRK